jgi:hypothetical protein
LTIAHDSVERAIGAYTHIHDETGLLTADEADVFDLKGVIERSLRVAFPYGPPPNEQAVQDQVAVILSGQGVEYTRERDVAAGAVKSFKPDFVVEEMDLAIDVKYPRPTRLLPKIEEEMAADVTGYQTRWKRVLFIVYDDGQIVDVEGFRRAHVRLAGVDIIVVKH